MNTVFHALARQALNLAPEITPVPQRATSAGRGRTGFELVPQDGDLSWAELHPVSASSPAPRNPPSATPPAAGLDAAAVPRAAKGEEAAALNRRNSQSTAQSTSQSNSSTGADPDEDGGAASTPEQRTHEISPPATLNGPLEARLSKPAVRRGGRAADPAPSPPPLRLEIGRIDIASFAAAPASRQRPVRPGSSVSLAQYLGRSPAPSAGKRRRSS